MAAPARPRTASRVGAVQALFQSEQAGETAETVIDQFVRHRLGRLPDGDGFEDGHVPDADVRLFARIVRTAVERQDRLDALVAEALPADWPFSRLDPVLRAMLRAATAELSLEDGPPPASSSTSISTSPTASSTATSRDMVNGLLNRLARDPPRRRVCHRTGMIALPARVRLHRPPFPPARRPRLPRPRMTTRPCSPPRPGRENWCSPPTRWSKACTSLPTTRPSTSAASFFASICRISPPWAPRPLGYLLTLCASRQTRDEEFFAGFSARPRRSISAEFGLIPPRRRHHRRPPGRSACR